MCLFFEKVYNIHYRGIFHFPKDSLCGTYCEGVCEVMYYVAFHWIMKNSRFKGD